MCRDLIQTSRSLSWLAGLLLLGVTPLSLAQSATIRGGGSTLPVLGYTGVANPSGVLTPVSGTLLYAYTFTGGNPAATYCATGSGVGKTVLDGDDPTHTVNTACPAGFGSTGLVQPHFTATDAPLTVDNFNSYQTGHGAGTQPVQFPAIAGAIGIVFKKAGVTALNLTEAQVCGIFSGQITNWADPALAGAITGSVTGPITVAYRTDESGTSFSFLNHLSAVCPANVSPGKVAATHFTTRENFLYGASAYTGAYTAWSQVTSNAQMVVAVNSADGVIGYAEAANGVAGGVRMASIRNAHSGVLISPVSGFGSTALPLAVTYDKLIVGTDLNGRPLFTPSSTTSQCIAVVNPSDYADPSAGYPILSVSYLLANTTGNGADAPAVRNLIAAPYNASIRAATPRIGTTGSGYAWINNADMTQAKANGCIVN